MTSPEPVRRLPTTSSGRRRGLRPQGASETFGLRTVKSPAKRNAYFAKRNETFRIGGRKPLKSAILVITPAVERYVKLHALVTDRSPLKVRMFKEYGAEAKWLDVPVELLQVKG